MLEPPSHGDRGMRARWDHCDSNVPPEGVSFRHVVVRRTLKLCSNVIRVDKVMLYYSTSSYVFPLEGLPIHPCSGRGAAPGGGGGEWRS